jgi:hypothetical protein
MRDTDGGGAANGVWKWIAALLAAVMLAGAPGFVHAIQSPTQAEVDLIRERQQQVLQRLAVIEVQINDNRVLLTELQETIDEFARERP